MYKQLKLLHISHNNCMNTDAKMLTHFCAGYAGVRLKKKPGINYGGSSNAKEQMSQSFIYNRIGFDEQF